MNKEFEVRKRKPSFVRKDSNKYNFRAKWRKPRGLHNKMRLKRSGHGVRPSVGYGVPKEIYGLHRSGLAIVNVSCLKDVEGLDPKKQGLMLSSCLGLRKKVMLLSKIKNFRVFNVKNVEQFLADVKSRLDSKKKDSKIKRDKRVKAKTEAEKKRTEKVSGEEKKDKIEKQKEFSKKVEASMK